MSDSLPKLYLITDSNQTGGRSLEDVVRSALEGGVRFIQLREKDLSGRELFELAVKLRKLTNRYGARLLINDRVDIALAAGADGVHLGRQSISVSDARRALKSLSNSSIIGVSTHSLEEALQAEADGADFITFGPVYFTPSKSAYGEPEGTNKLRESTKAVGIPVFALGGINKENIEEVLSEGVHGIAVISAVMAADDIKKASFDLFWKIDNHGRKADS